ncbi:MAG: hypothetical protein ACREJC_05755 [Tepidisphaeraceae bacterium]
MRVDPSVVRRFLAKCRPDPHSECILWTGALNKDGYPMFKWQGFTPCGVARANRVAFALFRSRVLEPHEDADHVCGVRSCVNQYHLRARDFAEHRPKAAAESQARDANAYSAWFDGWDE